MWYLHWNGAIVWYEMELVPGLFGAGCVLGKGWGRRNGIGVGNRVSAREGNTFAVGFNPAYELNEWTERPAPVRNERD